MVYSFDDDKVDEGADVVDAEVVPDDEEEAAEEAAEEAEEEAE